ncbi:MAG: MarR family winged helix-turn-helix transcriptional regulator [Acidimicrobiia bacterium]
MSDDLAEAIATTVVRINRRLRQETSVHGLTEARLAVLTRLDTEGRLSLSELAQAEGVAPATMARIVDALEEGRLLIRRPSVEDGRKVWLLPTTLGRSLARGSRYRRTGWLASYLSRLAEADRAIVRRAMELLVDAVEVPD